MTWEFVAGLAIIIFWLAVLVGVCWFCVSVFLAGNTAESIWFAVFGITLWFAITGYIGYAVTHKDDRPCVRYEETYIWNDTLKQMMPARYCAQYGEWKS